MNYSVMGTIEKNDCLVSAMGTPSANSFENTSLSITKHQHMQGVTQGYSKK